MNFIAPKARPTALRRHRPRMIGATLGVLVAVPFGAVIAAAPGDVPAPIAAPAADAGRVAGPEVVALPRPDVVVRPRPDVVAPPRPVVERLPARLTPTTAPPAPSPQRSAPRDPVPRDPVAPAAEHRSSSTLPRSTPTRVRIPTIGVDSELIGLGLQGDGRMEVPAGAFPAGWYTGAPTPGQLGPAILAGHVDYGGRAGVFSRLRELRPGDRVEVARADGVTAVFRVTRVEQHDKDAFPTAAVYGDIDHAGLRLITCGGSFDRGARSYEDNIVVFAELDATTVTR